MVGAEGAPAADQNVINTMYDIESSPISCIEYERTPT